MRTCSGHFAPCRVNRLTLVVSDSRLAGLLRTQILARIAACAMRRKRIQHFAFRVVSQIGLHYRTGALSRSLNGLPSSAPRAGDRFPWLRLKFRANGSVEDLFQKLDDTRLNLIVIGSLRSLMARAQIPRPSFYLLRPDGYVGLCRLRVNTATVATYASERLGLRTETT